MKKEYNDYFLNKVYSTPDHLVEDLTKIRKLVAADKA
jgi:hypothetical protein